MLLPSTNFFMNFLEYSKKMINVGSCDSTFFVDFTGNFFKKARETTN